jgi:hypothetical protein
MANPTADLVSRLRASETENRLEPRWPDALLKEAADEIVRLRTALASIVGDDSDPPGYSPVLGDPRDYWEAWAKELERRAREALGSAADVPEPQCTCGEHWASIAGHAGSCPKHSTRSGEPR